MYRDVCFRIPQNDYPDRKLPPRHFKYNYEHGSSGTYINLREVSAMGVEGKVWCNE